MIPKDKVLILYKAFYFSSIINADNNLKLYFY